jgi:hypothetical protein
MTGSSSPTSSASHSCHADGTPAHQRSQARTPPAGGGRVGSSVGLSWQLGLALRGTSQIARARRTRGLHTRASSERNVAHLDDAIHTDDFRVAPILELLVPVDARRHPVSTFRPPATNQWCACEPGSQQRGAPRAGSGRTWHLSWIRPPVARLPSRRTNTMSDAGTALLSCWAREAYGGVGARVVWVSESGYRRPRRG